MFSEGLVGQLGRLSARQNQLQQQASTGQRISLPEDDPGAVRRTLDLQAEASVVAQQRKNITVLKDRATVSYGALNALKRISDRAGELATLADGTKSPDDLKNYAAEVTQLIKQAAQLANTKSHGDYIFAGTKSDQPAFVLSTNGTGQVTAVTYQGNASVAQSEVAENLTATAQVVGANTSGSGPRGLFTDSGAGADFFNHLISLQNNLQAGNATAVNSTDLPALLKDEDNFLFHLAQNGAVQASLDTSDTLAANRSQSVGTLISGEMDADLAQTMVQLSQTQNAYRAALQSGGTILNISLLDYLH